MPEEVSATKAYLGDGVYVDVEHGMLKLTTDYGLGPTNTIYLEPEVYAQLLAYVENLKKRRSMAQPCAACREGEHTKCGGPESGCGCAADNHGENHGG